MSSPATYIIVDRIDERKTSSRKRVSVARFQVSPSGTPTATSLRSSQPTVHSTDPDEFTDAYPREDTQIDRENILFVYLDLHSQLLPQMVTSLRAINDHVRTFDNDALCFDFLQTSPDRVFFICPTTDKDLVKAVHELSAVEAIFILGSDAQLDRTRLPKIDGVYNNFEELLLGLRCTLEWFEQTQMEVFAVEKDRVFLWSQLWKEEFLKPTHVHPTSNKETLVSEAESYYRRNAKVLQSIGEFNHSYSRSDALQWSFHSVFPSRYVHHALRCRDVEQLDQCRFLLNDVSRVLQQSAKHKSVVKLYRGMVLSKAYIDQLDEHTGKLICPKGYFTCIKSRKSALGTATSRNGRSDLLPVLFKLTSDKSVPMGELSAKNEQTQIVFDFYTAFRIVYVVRDTVTTVKLECAAVSGKNIAREYIDKHGEQEAKHLLQHGSLVPKLPGRLPPLDKPTQPPANHPLSPMTADDEVKLEELIENSEVNQALEMYQRFTLIPARLLNKVGVLLVEKKGDYESAIKCFKKALRIQDSNGEDITLTLTQLAIAHENRQQFDQAFKYHTRALRLRENQPDADQAAIANSLLGIANSHWGQQNLDEALNYAKKALALNESLSPANDLNMAMNLAIIANIHHRSGDMKEALRTGTRALALLEQSVPADSPALASLLNNVAAMQLGVGSFSEARESFTRALKICEKTLPPGHPKRVTMETNIQRITQMELNQLEDITVEISTDKKRS